LSLSLFVTGRAYVQAKLTNRFLTNCCNIWPPVLFFCNLQRCNFLWCIIRYSCFSDFWQVDFLLLCTESYNICFVDFFLWLCIFISPWV